jgi:hypothetical protein
MAATAILGLPITIADRFAQEIVDWKHSISAESRDIQQFDDFSLFLHLSS